MGMPSGYPTLLDIAVANGSDQVVGLIDETSKLIPEVRLGASRTIRGTSYKIWVRNGMANSPFRNANEGTPVSKSAYEDRVVETFIMNPQWEADKAVADRYEDGAAAYIAIESRGVMEAAMQTIGRCFFYGRNTFTYTDANSVSQTYGGDAKGFPGLIDQFDTTYEVDAGGTTANTATSVWGVKFGPQNVTWVWGNGGEMTLPDPYITRGTDSNNNPLDIYRQSMLAYPGLQLGDRRSVVRIKNITTDAGKGLTDSLLFNAVTALPSGMVPDLWLMSRRSLMQLRASRTATNVTGAPAPIPTDGGGIPIYMTDSISNFEPVNFLGK
jgi:hypothetical protein